MSKASEGIFDDGVVYITKQGSQVGVDGGRITVYMKDEGEIASFPMGQVDTINIFGNINFTTPFVFYPERPLSRELRSGAEHHRRGATLPVCSF